MKWTDFTHIYHITSISQHSSSQILHNYLLHYIRFSTSVHFLTTLLAKDQTSGPLLANYIRRTTSQTIKHQLQYYKHCNIHHFLRTRRTQIELITASKPTTIFRTTTIVLSSAKMQSSCISCPCTLVTLASCFLSSSSSLLSSAQPRASTATSPQM